MKLKRSIATTLALAFISTVAPALRADDPAQALIKRVLRDKSDQVILETIAPENGMDVFELASKDGKVLIRGNSPLAIASGLNWYLKYDVNTSTDWTPHTTPLPDKLPLPTGERHVSTAKFRMLYNYCTFGYTMPWWQWPQWEEELDWAAMNGINMPMLITGQEQVWINTFKRFGYTDTEIRNWLVSPAHLPWQYMQNMHTFGGEMPQAFIDKRVALGQKTIQRARELGMTIIGQGYYGMLPTHFADKHPDARIIPQGGWAGGFKRPDMLDPGDPLFKQIASAFYEEQEKIFGKITHFAADPFHEGGISKGLDRGVCANQIQQAMLDHTPDAIWVKQCWQQANEDMFKGAVDRQKIIALDLNCDRWPYWEKANSFSGTPWVWCMIHNFGGNVATDGNLQRLLDWYFKAYDNADKKAMSGIGLVPEGHHHNYVIYDLMSEMIWHDKNYDLADWVAKYATRRYGREDAKTAEAWKIFTDTCYSAPPGESPANSVVTARPGLNYDLRSREFTTTYIKYDNKDFLKGVQLLLQADARTQTNDHYALDAVDFTRQLMANLGRPIFEAILRDYQKKDRAAFTRDSKVMLNLIRDMDTLCGTRPELNVGTWMTQAHSWASTPAEHDYLDFSAKCLLSTWAENPGTNLVDYANREWSGMLRDLYLPRWELFVQRMDEALQAGKPLDVNAMNKERGQLDYKWAHDASKKYDTQPTGNAIVVARQMLEKYAPLVETYTSSALAHWSPRQMSQTPKTIDWPIVLPKGATEAAIRFNYTSGNNRLDINWATLLVDGKEVARDAHAGTTGVKNEGNVYTLKFPAIPAGAKVVLRAEVSSAGGTDSNGDIVLEGP